MNELAARTHTPQQRWYFVDESGDPVFYDRRGNLIVGQPGCSPILILGFVETGEPQAIRQALGTLHRELLADPYLQGVPSLAKTALAFHAKDELPEVRYRCFKLLATLDFRAHIVVARKIERVFRNSFGAKEQVFYDHLVTQLFRGVLQRSAHSLIYFAKRGSRDRQRPLAAAIDRSIQSARHAASGTPKFSVQAQTPQGEPCLSVVDYVNWAVYQAFSRGEMRYYRAIEDKVRLLVDLYDSANYPNNWYSRRNPFAIEKATPL